MQVRYRLKAYDLLECLSCGFRAIPYLDNEEEPKPFTEAEVRRSSKSTRKPHLEGSKERLAALVNVLTDNVPGGSVLDVGCGGGHFIAAISEQYQAEGIELSPVWHEISRRRGIPVTNHPLQAAFWDDRAETFDAITLWDVIEHVNCPKDVVKAAHNLLKTGGKLLMDTPSRDGLLYRFGDLTTALSGGGYPTTLGIQYRPTPYDHKQIFRVKDMRRMLEEVGFKVQIVTKTELSMPVAFYLKFFCLVRTH